MKIAKVERRDKDNEKNLKQLVVAFVLGLVLVQGVTTVQGSQQPSTRASIELPWWL